MLEDHSAAVRDFCQLARCLALYEQRDDLFKAFRAGAITVPAHIKTLFQKTAVATGTTTDGTWGGALVDYQTIANGFLESLRSASAFDAMLPHMRRAPAKSSIAVVTAGAVGSIVAENVLKPLTKLSIEAEHTEPLKAVAVTVVTRDALRFSTPGTLQLFGDELRGGVAKVTDVPTLAALLSGISPASSSGDPKADVATLLAAVPLKALSSPMFLTSPSVIAQMAGQYGDSGPTFPDLTFSGGFVSGVPMAPCDSLSDYASNGDALLLVDCSQIVGDNSGLILDASQNTDLAMSDSPSGGGSQVSMFQANSVAIKVERRFNIARLRDSAVAALNHVSYTGSP